jgi:hypothetical protein
MKHFFNLLVSPLIVGLVIFFTACQKDEEKTINAPQNSENWSKQEEIGFLISHADFSFQDILTKEEELRANNIFMELSNQDLQTVFIEGFVQSQERLLSKNYWLNRAQIKTQLRSILIPIEIAEEMYQKSFFKLSKKEEQIVREEAEFRIKEGITTKNINSCNSYIFPLNGYKVSSGTYSCLVVGSASTPNDPNDCDYQLAFYTNGNLSAVNGKIGIRVENWFLRQTMTAQWGSDLSSIIIRQTDNLSYTHVLIGNGIDAISYFFVDDMATVLKNNIKIKQL